MKNKNIYYVCCHADISRFLFVIAENKKEAEKIAKESLEDGNKEYKIFCEVLGKVSTVKDFVSSGVMHV